jgi:Holliday junction resolvasome RuvABC endonuclease subunit
VILGLDLAFAKTGWALLQAGTPTAWGVITTSAKDSDQKRCAALLFHLNDILSRAYGGEKLSVFFEQSEWHQIGGDPRMAKRERQTQAALGLARGVLYCWANSHNLAAIALGVQEWRKEFGVTNNSTVKLQTAEVLALEFPSIICVKPVKSKNGETIKALFTDTQKPVADHITDAIAIARVGYFRTKQQTRIKESE